MSAEDFSRHHFIDVISAIKNVVIEKAALTKD